MSGSTDAYGSQGQTYRGSSKMKALKSVGSKTVNSQRRPNGGNRILPIEESSNQMVLYGRDQNSKQLADLPMALTFALQNGGKLQKLDSSGKSSILGFLHQIGRKSLDIVKIQRSTSFDKHRPSTSQYPIISHLHIEDVSRGVQNLNQILRACSNGLNFDKYSIEIGKDLLKGAMDLEESLRMLVNLQEASECMITTQRKNRIRLLDEEGEEVEENTVKIVEQKQLDLPRFSFDKPSRKSHGIKEYARTDTKQRLMALTYPTEVPVLPKKQAATTSNFMSHKRSASCGPDFKSLPTFSETRSQSNSSHSTQEKGRKSNVIAKLMGLEEISERVASQTQEKEASSDHKGGIPIKQTEQVSSKNVASKKKDIENLAPINMEKKLLQAKKVPLNQVIQSPKKNMVRATVNPEVVVPNRKLYTQHLERMYRTDAFSGLKKATNSASTQQSSITQLNQIRGSHRNFQKERGQDNLTQKEHKHTEKERTMEPVLRDERQQRMPQKDISPDLLQESIEGNESAVQLEKRSADSLLPHNQPKPRHNYGFHELHLLKNSEHQEEKHDTEKRKQTAKGKLQPRKLKGSEAEAKIASKTMNNTTSQKKQSHMNQTPPRKKTSTEPVAANSSNELPNSRHQENLVRDESPNNSISNLMSSNSGKSDQNASSDSRVSLSLQENPTLAATWKEVDHTQVHGSETPRKIAELTTRQNGTLHIKEIPLKPESLILQEMKQRRHEKPGDSKGADRSNVIWSKDAEANITGSNKSEAIMQHLDGSEQLHNKAEKTATSYNSSADPKNLQVMTLSDSCENIASVKQKEGTGDACFTGMVSDDPQIQDPIITEDPDLKSLKTSPNLLSVAAVQKGDAKISKLAQHKPKRVSTSETEDPLTEKGKQLREILLQSLLFLNTAEALFKLNIPPGILHASNLYCLDTESKLVLDCSYEVMKRKGRRYELFVHPPVQISISYVDINSLDHLVMELVKDIETLKAYGGNGSDECNGADNLHKMLERDVQNRDQEVNGMWDFGWNDKSFAFLEKDYVIKDVERHLLNGLIDEITQDLLPIAITV